MASTTASMAGETESVTSPAEIKSQADGEGGNGGDMQTWGYSKLSGYSVTLLCNILDQLESASLSTFATKALQIRGQRRDNQDRLLKVMEFLTGLDGI